MDEFETGRTSPSKQLFTLELEDSSEEVEATVEAPPAPSPFQSSKPCVDSGKQQSSVRHAAESMKAGDDAAGEPKIVFYESKSTGSSARLMAFCLVSGLIGALCFAGVSIFYFSIGRRVGLIFVIAFAALGARLGSQDLRDASVRWYAAITAGASALAGKALMVLMLFALYPQFSAEDLANFIDPGKSAAIYFEQSIVNALSTDGSNGQERLDQRFAEEYEGDETENEKLAFMQVFPRVIEGLDFFLILGAMFFTFKFAGNER